MKPNRRVLAVMLALIPIAAACSAGSGASASPSLSPIGTLTPSNPPSASASPGDSSSPAPSGGPISTPDQAAARVIEENPRFTGIGPKDPDLIGGCCWYEATRAPNGFQVVIEIGWGDCPSGCIEKHTWVYAVSPDGTVQLVSEDGPSVPPGVPPG